MSLASIYITVPDKETAQKICRKILEERLAACANILDGATSMYWWKDAIETAEEVVVIMKTQMRLVDRCVKAVKAAHPYEVPCVTAVPVLKANIDYVNWVIAETAPALMGDV